MERDNKSESDDESDSETEDSEDEGVIPIVLPPFDDTGTREHKFLSSVQLLRKIDPKRHHRDEAMDDARRQAGVWIFQKNSWSFPAYVVVKECIRLESSPQHRHKVAVYFGADIEIYSVPHEEIVSTLLRFNFSIPTHFTYVADDVR